MKKAIKIMVVIICIILLAMLFRNYVKDYKENNQVQEYADEVVSEEELLQKEYETQLKKVNELKQVISNDTEIILLTISDNYVVSHEKLTESFFNWLVSSQINLDIRYTAIISIPTDAICVEYINDTFEITYDTSKVCVKSVQIDNITSKYKYGLIAKEYTPSEISALTLLATDHVKEQLAQDELLKFRAEQNLVNYLQKQAFKLLIFNTTIKEKTLE